MTTKTMPISFRLDPKDKAALDLAAAEERRSLSNLLSLIVRDWLDRRERGAGE